MSRTKFQIKNQRRRNSVEKTYYLYQVLKQIFLKNKLFKITQYFIIFRNIILFKTNKTK